MDFADSCSSWRRSTLASFQAARALQNHLELRVWMEGPLFKDAPDGSDSRGPADIELVLWSLSPRPDQARYGRPGHQPALCRFPNLDQGVVAAALLAGRRVLLRKALPSKTAEVIAVLKDCHQRLPK